MRSELAIPPGACDSHAHVLPHSVEGPIDSPTPESYLRALDDVGFDRGVLVTSAFASTSGVKNRDTRAALALAPERLRGIALLSAGVSDAELSDLHSVGFRGARFAYIDIEALRRGVPESRTLNPLHDLVGLAPRLKELGWQAQIFSPCARIVEHAKTFEALEVPIVIDHMGWFDLEQGPDAATFRQLVAIVKSEGWWVKLTALRNAPLRDLDAVRPFHDAMLEAAPNRMVWGSDWPFIGMASEPPTTRVLLERFLSWTADSSMKEAILVTNPSNLFGF